MRRKGTRTITSVADGATSTAADPSSLLNGTPAPPAEGQRDAMASTAADGAFPAVSIPTLDIFARFQHKRDDFDANWLMLEEDAADQNKAPPISEDVSEKLRRHQQLLHTSRGAAGLAGKGRGAVTSSAAMGGSGASGVEATDKRKSDVHNPQLKGGDDFDRTAAEVGKAAEGSQAGKPRRTHPMDKRSDASDSEDEAYVPEGKDAAQYKRSLDKPSTAASADGGRAAEGQSRQQQQQPKEEEEVEEEGDGIQGDFLNFLPKNPAATLSNPNADASHLQAVVSLGSPTTTNTRTASARQQPGGRGGSKRGSQPASPLIAANTSTTSAARQPTTQTSPPSTSPTADKNTLVVPLWSVARVQRCGGYYPGSRLVALHQEVCDLVDFLRPTQAEISVRRHVELQIKRLTRKLWPRCQVIVYGSLYTHLLLPLSDVDMTLVNLPANVTPEEALTALAAEISREGLCHSAHPQLILKTRVPLIKFQHKDSLIDIDISVNAPDGKANSDIVINLLNFYPEARPLILVVKYFLQQRDMHEPYFGGLGSYAATLLVINFLQSHPIYTTRPQERPVTGLGKLLVDFFRYCGQYWSYQRCGISLTGGGHYFRRTDGGDGSLYSPTSPTSPRSPMGPPQAVVEDPLNGANNAASSLRNLHMITSVFANAYQALTAPFPTAFELNSSSSSSGSSSSHGASHAATGGGSRTASQVADFSPDAQRIALRPTLLSRILHVDADTVYRRQSIAAAHAQLVEADPEGMAETERYRADEDAPMLSGQHGLRVVSTASTAPSSPATREEALGLAALTTAAAAAAAAASESEGVGKRRKRARDAHSTSSASSSSSGGSTSKSHGRNHSDDDGQASGSNASSVRVDVSKATARRKQLSRQR